MTRMVYVAADTIGAAVQQRPPCSMRVNMTPKRKVNEVNGSNFSSLKVHDQCMLEVADPRLEA